MDRWHEQARKVCQLSFVCRALFVHHGVTNGCALLWRGAGNVATTGAISSTSPIRRASYLASEPSCHRDAALARRRTGSLCAPSVQCSPVGNELHLYHSVYFMMQ
jgi:hypothetical protein